jgi:hypothetical protein
MFYGMDMISGWKTILQPNVVKEEACKSTLQPILIGYAK